MPTIQGEVHPLAASFERIRALSSYLQAGLNPQPGDGWYSPFELFAPGSARLGDLMSYAQITYQTDSPEVIATTLLAGYQWIIIGPALACYLSERRVPDLSLHNVRVYFGEANDPTFASEVSYHCGRFLALPADPAAAHPDAIILPSYEAMRDWLRAGLETHLDWVVTQLQEATRARIKPLWRTVADRCAGTVIWLGRELNGCFGDLDRVEAEVAAFIQAPSSRLRNDRTGSLRLTYQDCTHLFLQRGACCYAFKNKTGRHGYCTTCPLQPPGERERRLLDYLKTQVEARES
jgi:hypothetical protein